MTKKQGSSSKSEWIHDKGERMPMPKKDPHEKVDNYKKKTKLVRLREDTIDAVVALGLGSSMDKAVSELVERYKALKERNDR